MAGNIVKWWKHKILGGYKQFSVQECTTDSEELMYHQVRAPSSCSAPPDLLLVSDRENNIPLKSPVVNIISATSPAGPASQQKHHHQQQQQQQQQNHHNQQQHHNQLHQQQQQIPAHSTPKDVLSKNTKNGSSKVHQQHCNSNAKSMNINGAHTQNGGSADATVEQGKDERIHLEEFTCDVSVEGGKSSQPLQFSFTFYDLDGHHGKITKDDIVGIVYTIYESIGKSVVVPHCGSKTINVRLTVSPDGKSKAAAAVAAASTGSKFKKAVGHSTRDGSQQTAHGGHSRRQHRYRPRKLVKTDDEDDDSTSEKEAVKKSFSSSKPKCCQQQQHQQQQQQQHQQQQQSQPEVENNLVDVNCGGHENIYENMTNLKEECKGCLTQQQKSELYLKQASTRVKMLRKARKQKYQDHCHESRQRSLSVGNESCWKIRANNSIKTLSLQQQQQHNNQQQEHNSHQHQHHHHHQHHHQHQHQTDNNTQTTPDQDVIDGLGVVDGGVGGGGTSSGGHNTQAQVNNTSNAAAAVAAAECWNNALNRNDLIDIIRESMEKNRLCFQSNGKPQANVSPIRHRQRSNTVSKIPTSTTNNNNNNNHNHITSTNNTNTDPTAITHHHHSQHQQQQHDSNNHSHHHPQPHIPIYHQQMAINPAVLAAQNGIVHSKMNLCGYDSFLHATICSGGTSHSPTPPNSSGAGHIQPVATVQPIMTSSPKIYVSNQIKTSKILRNNGHHSQQNSPQFHGYHRLSSGSHSAAKLNISLLNALSPNLSNQEKFHQTIEHVEKWLSERDRKLLRNAADEKCKKDVKNYDNLLFARLTEKLQQQQLQQESGRGNGSGNKENLRRMHNSQNHNLKMHHHRRSQQSAAILAPAVTQTPSGSSASSSEKFLNSSKYVTLIPINRDPLECENLLHQTSDEESTTVPRTPSPPNLIGDGIGGVGGEENRSSSSSSSLIHRYVHEHIHHHYHHFENKDE